MREGWKEVELEELGNIGRGKSRHRPRNADFLYGNQYPFVQTADVKAAEYKITTYSQMYSEAGLLQSKLWPKDTLCITIAANIADSSILGIEACFPDSVVGFNSNPLKSDVYFVKYLFDMLQIRIKQISQGTAQDNLSLEKIRTLRFTVPKVETQRKIASVLSGYDDLIENNLKRIKILEEMAQQTYEEWFVRMRFPGFETVEMKDGLPMGWEKLKLGELWEIQSSKRIYLSDYVEFGIPFFRGKEITQKGENSNISDLLYISKSKFEELKNKFGAPKSGDILLTAVGTLGNLYMVKPTDTEFYFKDGNLIWLKANTNFSSYFLFYTLKSDAFQNHLKNIAIGSSQKALTIKGLKETEVVYPTKEIISNFDKIVKPINFSIENLQSQNQRLREARDILLPRLMMGMVDIDHLTVEKETFKVVALEIPKKEVSKEFKEAVLIAMLTDHFGSEQYPLGRKRYTKLSYLFHRYSDNKIQDYLRKAAGPYNPKTKYGGPEKIALSSKYIQDWKSDKGMTGFVVAEKIEDAKGYFHNYWQIADLDWLTTTFKYKSNDDLELLATVDNSLVELSNKNMELNTTNVLAIIKSEKEWEAKLERTVFRDANVEKAIGFLRGILDYGGSDN